MVYFQKRLATIQAIGHSVTQILQEVNKIGVHPKVRVPMQNWRLVIYLRFYIIVGESVKIAKSELANSKIRYM